MIDLYTFGTPNGRKASIMLEEVGLPYEVHAVDIGKGHQSTPAFRAMSPNGKIPVIHDRETGRTIFETGAILLYLARKTGQFEPDEDTIQWMFLQAAHIGPMVGQLGHFKVHAKEQVPTRSSATTPRSGALSACSTSGSPDAITSAAPMASPTS